MPPVAVPSFNHVVATRYITPLREGGSVPALVEGNDGQAWVVKLRGAGQGARVLIAELIAGQLGRALGLAVPELTSVELDLALARTEPDIEVQDILRASVGVNLGLRHLDGAVTFDPAARPAPGGDTASAIVALDSFTTNVDRTARNPNLLWWKGVLAPIDHGAALYWQHDWGGIVADANPARRFPLIRQHVLLPWADQLVTAGERLADTLTDDMIAGITAQLPDAWLAPLPDAATPDAQRAAYAAWLRQRRGAIPDLMEEAARARTPTV
ncbi:MAG TPA: HipA family kinase [Burkholderiaceae bacterium]|jgi:hypothetical protein|nr:HipA family kinase [Burkholderiaceae bacterium]